MPFRGATGEITYVAVVDDDESLRRSFSRLLCAAGFQPVAYPSAEAFLQDSKRPQFDCLVLDINLPGMSGIELSQRLTAVADATPVIFITAHDDEALKEQASIGGHAGFFLKSDSGDDVMDAIQRASRQPRREITTSEPLSVTVPAGTAMTAALKPGSDEQQTTKRQRSHPSDKRTQQT